MKNTMQSLEKLSELVNELQFDASKFSDQVIDQEKVDWYKQRFTMFVEDGVPDAKNAYLKKLLHDSVNELTRAVILHEALSI